MTKEEIYKEIEHYKKLVEECTKDIDFYNAMQIALKNVMNGSYGAIGNKGFACFNSAIANSITAQGRHLIKYVAKRHEDYWYDAQHRDTKLHNILGITNVKKINNKEQIIVYGDTDCVSGNSKIKTISGDITIEKLFHLNNKGVVQYTNKGHEVVKCDRLILSYDFKNNIPIYCEVENIMRKKVKKEKFKLKTKSGKVLELTNDHTLIVFRDGEKINIKPSEQLKGDKIVTLI